MDITISNGSLSVTINPKGAELNSLRDNNTEYLWEGNPKYWGKHSPVLFPIVGTLRNNSYLYKGQTYAMTRHGFARDNTFSVKSQTENSAVFSLLSNDETRRVYPFDFELKLEYILDNQTLHINYSVINKGDDEMPFSIGAHPAFALPGNFEDYILIFEKDEQPVSTQLSEDLLSDTTQALPVINRKFPLNYELFANDALILKSHASRSVEIAKNGETFLKVNFEDFPHLGLWTKEGAPFLCIEPWQGYSDHKNATGNIVEKEGIIHLKKSETYRAGFSITILR